MSQPTVTPSMSRMPTYKPIFSGKKGASISVKVVHSSISKLSSGKLDFEKLGQTFVEVNESTANVDFITTCIQKWGYDYVLVTSDGLRIEDSAGTQGNVYYCQQFFMYIPIICIMCHIVITHNWCKTYTIITHKRYVVY